MCYLHIQVLGASFAILAAQSAEQRENFEKFIHSIERRGWRFITTSESENKLVHDGISHNTSASILVLELIQHSHMTVGLMKRKHNALQTKTGKEARVSD